MNMYDRIKLLRTKYLHMTQNEFGEALGVKSDVINNIENNRLKNPENQEPIYRLICERFDVDEQWLRSGTGDDPFRQLTEQQQLMKYTALLMNNKDSAVAAAIQALIVTYEQLDDVSKATLEKIALQYIDNLKKSQ